MHAADNTALELEIKQMLVEALQLEDMAAAQIDSHAPLFGEGLGLDSVDALEIAVALQRRYGLRISAGAADTREYFATVATLATLVRKLTAEAAAGSPTTRVTQP